MDKRKKAIPISQKELRWLVFFNWQNLRLRSAIDKSYEKLLRRICSGAQIEPGPLTVKVRRKSLSILRDGLSVGGSVTRA